MSSDVFYHMDTETLVCLEEMGVLGLDMETAALYGVAARHGVRALSVLTVSDRLGGGSAMSSAEREDNFLAAVLVALDAAMRVRDTELAGDRT
jgi:purine-nucleoside phosphorylase